MKKDLIFKVGGNFADGSRFEADDVVPADLSKEEFDVLEEMGAFETAPVKTIKQAAKSAVKKSEVE